MTIRTIMICVLAAAMTANAAGRAPAPPRPPGDDLRITSDEEAEAHALIGEFNRKFAETNDIAPLVEDYFVNDFASRLIEPPNVFPFSLIGWKKENVPAGPEDRQRFYAAATNFLHDLFPLYAARMKACAQKEGGARDETCDDDEPKLEKVLPPAAVEIINTAPRLREWLGSEDEGDARADAAGARAGDTAAPEVAPTSEVAPTAEAAPPAEVAPPAAVAPTGEADSLSSNECAEGCDGPDADREQSIRNEKELRHLTSVFESLHKILRENLEARPFSFEKNTAADSDESDGDEPFANFDPERVKIFGQARVLRDEFYGYPKGTRLVCADAGALHVELVRVDGRLRILTVHLLIDD